MASTPLEVSLEKARAARDAGLLTVTEHNLSWLEQALLLLPRMKEQCQEATGEMMRLWLLRRGLSNPTSVHAWGAMVRSAYTRGLIADTGRSMSMATVKSHARRTPIWRFK